MLTCEQVLNVLVERQLTVRSAHLAVSGHVIRPITLEHVVLVSREVLVQVLLQEDTEFPELVIVQPQSLSPGMEVGLRIIPVDTVERIPLANADHALVLVYSEVPVVVKVQSIPQEAVGIADLETILDVG